MRPIWILAQVFGVMFLVLLRTHSEVAVAQTAAGEFYREGLRLSEQSCVSDGFELEPCREAIKKLENALKLYPKDTMAIDAYLAVARGYWNISFVGAPTQQEEKALRNKALALTLKAAALDEKSAAALYQASIYAQDDNERIALLKNAIERSPQHSRAHGLLARLLLLRGEVDSGFKEYMTQLEVSPHFDKEKGSDHVAFAESLTRAGHPEKAVIIFEKVFTLKEPLPDLCQYLSVLDLGPYVGFKEFMDKAQELELSCKKGKESGSR